MLQKGGALLLPYTPLHVGVQADDDDDNACEERL